MRSRLLNGLILVILFLLLCTLFAVYPTEICNEAKSHAEQDCAFHSLGFLLVYRTARFVEDWNAIIVAFATIAIAGFTYTLWRSTDRLWNAGERQIKLSADTAQRQLRAYIAITECRYATAGDRWIVCGRFKNVGQTPAFDIRIRGDAFIKEYPLREVPKMDFEIKDLSKTSLFPTEDLPYYEIGNKRPPAPDRSKPPSAAAFTWAGKALWLMVEVRYLDTFGKEHFTRRCLHSGNVIPAVDDFEHFHAHAEGNEAD